MDIWDVEQPVVTKRGQDKAEKDIVLSVAQKTLISNRWKNDSKAPPSIPELLDIAFPRQNLDGRSKEATAIKEFLVNSGINSEPLYKAKRNFELSIEHKEYLKNNYSTMRPIEMARSLFGNNISPGSSEVKEISSFLRTLDKKPMYGEEIESNYSPPRSLDRLVSRLKKYVDEVKDWDNKNLTPTQRKQSEMKAQTTFRPKDFDAFMKDNILDPIEKEFGIDSKKYETAQKGLATAKSSLPENNAYGVHTGRQSFDQIFKADNPSAFKEQKSLFGMLDPHVKNVVQTGYNIRGAMND